MDLMRKRTNLTDKEKLVLGYHLLENNKEDEAKKILGQVSSGYMATTFHKDISRALLCWSVCKKTENEEHRKESEFYLIIYRLTKRVSSTNLMFKNSGHFVDLKDTLFKGFKV